LKAARLRPMDYYNANRGLRIDIDTDSQWLYFRVVMRNCSRPLD